MTVFNQFVVYLLIFAHCSVGAQAVIQDAKTFANSASGINQARGTINPAQGAQNVPNFTTSTPQSNYFENGRGNLAPHGQTKINDCASNTSTNAYSGQDCNAINFLQRQKSGWALNGKDPGVLNVVSQSKDPIANPSAYNGPSSGSSCRPVTRKLGATYDTLSCTTEPVLETVTCFANWQSAQTIVETCADGTPPVPIIKQGSTTHMCRSSELQLRTHCAVKDSVPVPDQNGQATCQKGMITDAEGVETPNYIPGEKIEVQQEVLTPTIPVQRTVEGYHDSCGPLADRADPKKHRYPTCTRQATVCDFRHGATMVTPSSIGSEPPPLGAVSTQVCSQLLSFYTCTNNVLPPVCPGLDATKCEKKGVSCKTKDQDGYCTEEEVSYYCETTPERVVTGQVCGDPAQCEANPQACFDTTSPPDADFSRSVAAMEAARQAGVYAADMSLFDGTPAICGDRVHEDSFTKRVTKSCCVGQPGAEQMSNKNTASKVGRDVAQEVVTVAGKEVYRAGTRYVYDALYSATNPEWLNAGLESMLVDNGGAIAADGTAVAASSTTNFSLYGFQFSWSAEAGFEFVAFDVTTFVVMVVIMVVMDYLSCEKHEQETMVKIGAGLCAETESFCSRELNRRLPPRVCIERTRRHCCFNSVLAKIINRQGGAQIGRDPKNCAGFSQAEFERIDFSRIDFAEFIALVNGPANDGALANATRTANDVSRLQTNYYNSAPSNPNVLQQPNQRNPSVPTNNLNRTKP